QANNNLHWTPIVDQQGERDEHDTINYINTNGWKLESIAINDTRTQATGTGSNHQQQPQSIFERIFSDILSHIEKGLGGISHIFNGIGKRSTRSVNSPSALTTVSTARSGLNEVANKRGFVLSKSTFVGSGQYAGTWLTKNSQWADMRQSIIGMLEYNLFGIPYVGADICGSNGVVTAELCKRWSQVGAFYPLSRNNHDNPNDPAQDPAVWAERGNQDVTKDAQTSLLVRYEVLPYLYTLFYKAHVFGNTVARPLFHEFPTDPETYAIDQQFMLGPVALVSPFLFENQTTVSAYIPDDVWYEPTQEFVKLYPHTGHQNLADGQFPPVYLRGGHIIPMGFTGPANSQAIRDNPITMEVYPKNKQAKGDMFWDDGDSINAIEQGRFNFFEMELFPNCTVTITNKIKGYNTDKQYVLGRVLVANTQPANITATLDGKPVEPAIFKEEHNDITVNIDLNSAKLGQTWVIEWQTTDGTCNLN
ncbi:unnamed protein product, partial [Oppiella nova]